VQLSSSSSIVRFATFEVDLERVELRKNGLKVRLQEQPFQVLVMLLKSPGEVVTREELRDSVWPRDTFVDFDHALNTAVKKIRAALGDDADNPRFLATVPRRGYRFIAPLDRELLTTLEPMPVPAPAPPVPRTDPFRTFAIIGVVAVGLMVLGLAWKVVPGHRDDPPPEFHRLTFGYGDVEAARFTSDGALAVFSATPAPGKHELFQQRLDGTSSQLLGSDEFLLASSPNGDLAIKKTAGEHKLMSHAFDSSADILARVSLGGGAPRDLLTGVEAADWSPDGQLAVVRRVNDKARLEFPVGKVLYETTGSIASPRFAPRGNLIAFLDHPVYPDDRGSVAVVDLKGNKRTISSFWESERGLAWSPSGDEVWFAATRSGVGRALYGITLSGQQRRLLSVAGGVSLDDVSRDGRVLLTQDNSRLGVRFIGPGLGEPRELSWFNWSMAAGLSPDGKQLLFGEEGENAGPSYQVGLRQTDGSAPVILGEGIAQSLSPDGNWVLSVVPPPGEQLLLLPTGPGNPKPLERGLLEHYQFIRAGWFPDGKHVFFAGNEAGHGQRCYIESIDGGPPRPLTPEGIAFCSVAPDGTLLALTEDFRAQVYPSGNSTKPRKEIPLHKGDVPIGWTEDARFVYLVASAQQPPSIVRLELATGKRQLWKQMPTPAANIVINADDTAITPDGQSYAYTYEFCLSDLYLVRGLK
jgi:DNA-binding winged helix-turn-helix (wHTH) protein